MSLKIDDKYLEDFGLMLEDYTISATPEIKTRRIDITGRDGSVDNGTNYGNNSIKIKVCADESDMGTLFSRLRAFTSWLDPRQGDHQFLFEDDPTVIRFAKLDASSDYSKMKGIEKSVADVDLTFIMSDPFTYGATLNSTSHIFAPAESITIANNGGLDAPMVIRFHCTDTASMNPANGIGGVNAGDGISISGVKIQVNNTYIKYTGVIYTGDEVVIDTKEMTMDYDEDNALRYWEGDFPMLAVGNNTIIVTDDTGLGANVTIEFRERWL